MKKTTLSILALSLFTGIFFSCNKKSAAEKALGFNLSTIRSELIEHTADGRIPMVPVLSSSYGMMVNEDIFKKEGIELPQTYSVLVTACTKLKAAGYKSPIMVYEDRFMALPLIYS